ncbi:MAG: hypothetical protein AAB576_09175 [Elusimicrobiota bacterium]
MSALLLPSPLWASPVLRDAVQTVLALRGAQTPEETGAELTRTFDAFESARTLDDGADHPSVAARGRWATRRRPLKSAGGRGARMPAGRGSEAPALPAAASPRGRPSPLLRSFQAAGSPLRSLLALAWGGAWTGLRPLRVFSI